MHTLAVIPARGGSKAVPLKNIRELGGKPLVAWAIEACNEAESVDRTVVSTDHEGIAEAAREWGAEVPFMRPAEHAGDLVTLDPVIYHAVTTLEEQEDTRFDVVLTVQPTNPTLKPETLDHAVETLMEGGYDSVLTLRETHHLYWRKVNGEYQAMFPERLNRQELEPIYYETGVVFASKRSIITPENRLGTNIGHIVVSDDEALDIDTELDMKLAELVIEDLRNREDDRT
jgi:CMP-N-acetylneuraminic acid synthetase